VEETLCRALGVEGGETTRPVETATRLVYWRKLSSRRELGSRNGHSLVPGRRDDRAVESAVKKTMSFRAREPGDQAPKGTLSNLGTWR